jgi:dihydroorotase-like cyclic amidohydrolase
MRGLSADISPHAGLHCVEERARHYSDIPNGIGGIEVVVVGVVVEQIEKTRLEVEAVWI